jgi:hypothetical protein
MAKVPLATHLKLFYFSYLSQPQADRIIYRAICRHRSRKIVELGIRAGQRAVRMVQVAGLLSPIREVHFTGMDWFESGSGASRPGMTLKAAYRLLYGTGARVQLVPGDPIDSLAQTANALRQVDLLIFSALLDASGLGRVWFYVPRLLHQRSLVFVECPLPDGSTALQLLARSEIDTLAAAARRRAA